MSGDADRQTGRTTKQITEAPRHAFYVVANYDQLRYVVELATALGREDVCIMTHYHFMGRIMAYNPVVLDHATLELMFPDEAASLRSWMEDRADVG